MHNGICFALPRIYCYKAGFESTSKGEVTNINLTENSLLLDLYTIGTNERKFAKKKQ